MLKPLTLGNKTFSNNIIQGPLAGVSCAPFRQLVWHYSQPAFTCTEMISCKTLIHQSKLANKRFIHKSKSEGPVSFQLSGTDPNELAEAVKIATDYGADLIDLNCGCPVKKIRRRGAGSSLLTQPLQLYKLIYALKVHTHLPVSIKIRVEGEHVEKFNAELAKVVTEGGADFLVVHGRHWTEDYAIPCRYDQIAYFVETLKIPVIGNGDIACLNSLHKMFATGCAGVMVGRASVGQPWLIGLLQAQLQSQSFDVPTAAAIAEIFLHHVQELILLLDNEKLSIFQARKFAKYYARNLNNKLEFMAAINCCDTLTALKQVCAEYFIS